MHDSSALARPSLLGGFGLLVLLSGLIVAACGGPSGGADGARRDAGSLDQRFVEASRSDGPPLVAADGTLRDRPLSDRAPHDLPSRDGSRPAIVAEACTFASATGFTFGASAQWGTTATFGPARAMDQDDLSAWCGAATASTVTVKTNSGDEVFGSFWEVEFPVAQTVGSLHMRSGFLGSATNPAPTWKVRDFVWAYQAAGAKTGDPWIKIAETDLYANRYQLIFRFGPLTGVKRMRLLVRPPDPLEIALFPSTYPCPCLREVTLCSAREARIPVKPWFYTVVTFEAENTSTSKKNSVYQFHAAGSAGAHRRVVKQALLDLTGKSYGGTNPNDPFLDGAYADMHDVIWFSEFHPARVLAFDGSSVPGKVVVKGSATPLGLGCSGAGCLSAVSSANQVPAWITHEPAPAGFLLTGNYLDYKDRSAELASGFYHFFHQTAYSALGTCGGHQMLAMAQLANTYADFAKELYPYPDSVQQIVTSCATLFAPSCKTSEHGGINKQIASNTVGGVTIANTLKESRQDLVLNLLDDVTLTHPNGFWSTFYHYDLVNPGGAFAASFHLIGTYSTAAAPGGIDAVNFTLVQAMKVRGKPAYGAQFHWDAGEHVDAAGHVNESGRLAQNFIAIGLSRMHGTQVPVAIKTNNGSGANLVDLDKSTSWCAPAGKDGVITLEMSKVPSLPVTYLMMLTGQDSKGSNAPSQFAYYYSDNNVDWLQVAPSQVTSRSLGGDPRTLVFSLGQTLGSLPHAYFKAELQGGGCLRELLPLDLAVE